VTTAIKKNYLGWEPQVSFKELLKKMVQADIEPWQNGKIATCHSTLSGSINNINAD
jgi:hypothetical protein